jgi:hypothetical protein
VGSLEGRSAGVQRGGGAPASPCMCSGFLLSPHPLLPLSPLPHSQGLRMDIREEGLGKALA